MKRGYRLLGWALLLSGAPSACGGGGGDGSAATGAASGGGGGAGAATTSSGGGGGAGGAGVTTASNAGSGGAGAGPTGECAELAAGPIEPTRITDVFSGSEDFAFNGQGHIVAKQGPNLIRYDATGQTSNFASLPGTVLGLKYRPDGTLVAALPDRGAVVKVQSTGQVDEYVKGLSAPNGLSVDADGNVWATETAGNRVVRLNPDATVDEIAGGEPEVSQPNGIVFDPARRVVFYTNASAGEIRRIDLAARDDEPARPALVTTVASAVLDGLVLDSCGHLYAVDGKDRELYRVRLDAGGAALGEPELLASFPTSVANAQFGSGPGFNRRTLYVGGVAGSIYAVALDIGGAPVPAPPAAP
ncbi:SMP-30/gluconolactonase/LRE family protein [Sorangium sp. So ce1097]|uniref:SMP-30/gluconolactonase/LRE family protein n=1 Tax=Sorangium sp. So ce1097 TaxID=3133330 RepID=UPI003F5F3167